MHVWSRKFTLKWIFIIKAGLKYFINEECCSTFFKVDGYIYFFDNVIHLYLITVGFLNFCYYYLESSTGAKPFYWVQLHLFIFWSSLSLFSFLDSCWHHTESGLPCVVFQKLSRRVVEIIYNYNIVCTL